MPHDDEQTQSHQRTGEPRPARRLRRLVLILAIPTLLTILTCATLGLVSLTSIGGQPPLLLYLVAETLDVADLTAPGEAGDGAGPAVSGTIELPAPGAVVSPMPPITAEPSPTSDGVAREQHIPILMYHYVSAPPPDSDVYRVDLSTPPEKFDEQMRWLKENGYSVVSLEHVFSYLNTGAPALPDKPVVLTFDDGYVDNYEHAFPVLKKYGFSGTFFVLTDVTDRRQEGYMTWEMLREMHEAGMDIQVHGREHLEMAGRDHDWLIYHLLGPAQTIEANLGYKPRFLAYPSGQYDAEVIAAAQEVGYWAAVTTTQGSLQTNTAPFELRRLRVRGAWNVTSFAGIVREYTSAPSTSVSQ